MKPLLWMGVISLGAALALSLALRQEPDQTPTVDSVPAPPGATAEIELTGAGMIPYRVRIPKDHMIHLTVRGAPDAGEGLLTLTGYEDQVPAVDMGPGLARELVFLSSRPGDDFAFLLGGDVQGRLEVTGSHLEEGHQ